MEKEKVRISEVSRKRRMLAGILGCLVLFMLLFSSFFIAIESGHECDGHDCPICSLIKQCEAVIRVFKEGKTKHATPILPVLLLILTMHIVPALTTSETPVSRKVQLNN